MPLLVIGKELPQLLNVFPVFALDLLLVASMVAADRLLCLLKLCLSKLDHDFGRLDLLFDVLHDLRVDLVTVRLQLLLFNAFRAQVVVCALVVGEHELAEVALARLLIAQRWLLIFALMTR